MAGLVPKEVPIDDLAQALRSIGEPIFGQEVKIFQEVNYSNNCLM